jgi:hypothetical protein
MTTHYYPGAFETGRGWWEAQDLNTIKKNARENMLREIAQELNFVEHTVQDVKFKIKAVHTV